MKVVGGRKKLETIPEESKTPAPVTQAKIVHTETKLNSNALSYIDDLFANQEKEEMSMFKTESQLPDINIEQVQKSPKTFKEDIDTKKTDKILDKSVVKKKVKFDDKEEVQEENDTFISGYEADDTQTVQETECTRLKTNEFEQMLKVQEAKERVDKLGEDEEEYDSATDESDQFPCDADDDPDHLQKDL